MGPGTAAEKLLVLCQCLGCTLALHYPNWSGEAVSAVPSLSENLEHGL